MNRSVLQVHRGTHLSVMSIKHTYHDITLTNVIVRTFHKKMFFSPGVYITVNIKLTAVFALNSYKTLLVYTRKCVTVLKVLRT
jgi:hypothetical protein